MAMIFAALSVPIRIPARRCVLSVNVLPQSRQRNRCSPAFVFPNFFELRWEHGAIIVGHPLAFAADAPYNCLAETIGLRPGCLTPGWDCRPFRGFFVGIDPTRII